MSLTTERIAEAAGVSVQTVRRWSKAGLLPPFRVVYGTSRGKRSYWPAHAAAQAAWVRAQNDAGRTFDEIRAALAAGEFAPLVLYPSAACTRFSVSSSIFTRTRVPASSCASDST